MALKAGQGRLRLPCQQRRVVSSRQFPEHGTDVWSAEPFEYLEGAERLPFQGTVQPFEQPVDSSQQLQRWPLGASLQEGDLGAEPQVFQLLHGSLPLGEPPTVEASEQLGHPLPRRWW